MGFVRGAPSVIKNPDGTETQLLNFSELNSLKYSGGFVF